MNELLPCVCVCMCLYAFVSGARYETVQKQNQKLHIDKNSIADKEETRKTQFSFNYAQCLPIIIIHKAHIPYHQWAYGW